MSQGQQFKELYLELITDTVKETFSEFDIKKHQQLKYSCRGYDGDKPNQKDWSDLIDENKDFREEFQCIYNGDHIREADDYTPEV